MPKKFWQFRNQAADSAELLLYGDISDSSWWGDEVTPKTFADELNALGPLTSLTVRERRERLCCVALRQGGRGGLQRQRTGRRPDRLH